MFLAYKGLKLVSTCSDFFQAAGLDLFVFGVGPFSYYLVIFSIAFFSQFSIPRFYQALEMNFLVSVLTLTISPASRYSGIWISTPFERVTGLVFAEALALFIPGTVCNISKIIERIAGRSLKIQ